LQSGGRRVVEFAADRYRIGFPEALEPSDRACRACAVKCLRRAGPPPGALQSRIIE